MPRIGLGGLPEFPDPPGKQWRFPKTRAIFFALHDAEAQPQFLAAALEKALQVSPMSLSLGAVRYSAPPDDHLWNSGDRATRRKAAMKMRWKGATYSRSWGIAFDEYHYARYDLDHVIIDLRRMIDEAASELDAGEPNPQRMPSLRLRQALQNLNGVTAAPMMVGPYPAANTEDVADRLRQAGRKLVDLEGELNLRQIAYQELPPVASPATLPAVLPPAVAAEPKSVPREDGYLSVAQLAERFGVPREPLRKRLERLRGETGDGWIETADRVSRDPKFLYSLAVATPAIDSLRASVTASANRPSLKNNLDSGPENKGPA